MQATASGGCGSASVGLTMRVEVGIEDNGLGVSP